MPVNKHLSVYTTRNLHYEAVIDRILHYSQCNTNPTLLHMQRQWLSQYTGRTLQATLGTRPSQAPGWMVTKNKEVPMGTDALHDLSLDEPSL